MMGSEHIEPDAGFEPGRDVPTSADVGRAAVPILVGEIRSSFRPLR